MNHKNALEPTKNDIGTRIDLVLLSEFPKFTRTSIKTMVINGNYKVNGEKVMPNYRIKQGDIIEWSNVNEYTNKKSEEIKIIKPKYIPFKVIFEDENILIVNKPEGVNIHPISRNDSNSLLNGIYHYIQYQSKFDKKVKPRQVHRLDQGTSGVTLIAKTPGVHHFYSKQFEHRNVEKEYYAIVEGDFEKEQYNKITGSRSTNVRITSNLLHNEELKITTVSTKKDSKFAETIVEFNSHFNKFGKRKFSLVKVKPKTGRKHQIRAHLSHYGYPILGDKIYGGQKYKRIMLHAYRLTIPSYKERSNWLTFEADLPEIFIDPDNPPILGKEIE